MGRWTFQDGRPLYIPDPGEEGGGSMLGHLAAGFGETLEKGKDVLGRAAGAIAEAPATPIIGGPTVGDVMTGLGAPVRAVVATGHSLAPGGYQGKTDPIDYIMTGEKEDESDLAGYGDLLADTMEAEGTINEQGIVSKVVRGAGNVIQDPLVLFGLARAATAPMALGRPAAASSAEGGTALARQVHGGGPGGGGWTAGGGGARPGGRGVMRAMREAAEDAKPGPGGGGVAGGPGSPRQLPARASLDSPGTQAANRSANRAVGRRPRVDYRQPPIDPEVAAEKAYAPLDRDLASPGVFDTGGTKNLAQGARAPRGAAAARRAERFPRAARMGREEQLAEGTRAMRGEQLAEGQKAMTREELANRARTMGTDAPGLREPGAPGRLGVMDSAEADAAFRAMRAGQLQEGVAADMISPRAIQTPWPETSAEFATRVRPSIVNANATPGYSIQGPMPRAAVREVLMSAIENGASADDIYSLLLNLGG